LGLIGSGLCVPHPLPDLSLIGDHMQSFTEDPYVTDEKFREKGRSLINKNYFFTPSNALA